MVAPTCFVITLPSSRSFPSAFWEMLNWGAVDRILWMGVLCLVLWSEIATHHVTRHNTLIHNFDVVRNTCVRVRVRPGFYVTQILSLHLHAFTLVGLLPAYVVGGPVRGSNYGGGEIFLTRPDRPWVPPSLLCKGYRIIAAVRRSVRGVDYPSPTSAEVKERIENSGLLDLGRLHTHRQNRSRVRLRRLMQCK
jgi:hypothetical protein